MLLAHLGQHGAVRPACFDLAAPHACSVLYADGTSDATRKAAAKQIADIAKVHPEQLPSIVRKVRSGRGRNEAAERPLR